MLRRLAIITLANAAAASAAFAQTPAAPATPATPAVRQQLPGDSLAIARKYTMWLWSNQFDSIMAHRPASERTAENRQSLADQTAQITSRAGVEDSVIGERWVRRNGNRQYWRTSRFSDFRDEPLVLRLVMMPDGTIAGMGFGPASQVPPIDPEP